MDTPRECPEDEDEPAWWLRVYDVMMWTCSDAANPYVDIGLFIVCVIILALTMDHCVMCVFGVLLVSMVFCCRLRFMFVILWACIFVLWVHGWRFGGGKGLSIQWN
jgi:hypothetical protein